jgi:hypothetical protein
MEIITSFIKREKIAPRFRRAKHLIGIPVVGTGMAGHQANAGLVCGRMSFPFFPQTLFFPHFSQLILFHLVFIIIIFSLFIFILFLFFFYVCCCSRLNSVHFSYSCLFILPQFFRCSVVVLLEVLSHWAKLEDMDFVLICFNKLNYDAALRVRKQRACFFTDDMLSKKLKQKAVILAQQARSGHVAIFVGAGYVTN